MEKRDSRGLPDAVLNERRRRAVKLRKALGGHAKDDQFLSCFGRRHREELAKTFGSRPQSASSFQGTGEDLAYVLLGGRQDDTELRAPKQMHGGHTDRDNPVLE